MDWMYAGPIDFGDQLSGLRCLRLAILKKQSILRISCQGCVHGLVAGGLTVRGYLLAK